MTRYRAQVWSVTYPRGLWRTARPRKQVRYVRPGKRRVPNQPWAIFTRSGIPHINQVYMLYHAVLETAEFAPGPESLDVELSRWTPFLGKSWPFIQ